MKGRLYSFLAVVTILFFAFLAGFALLHTGLPPTHDGEYHIIRFYEFDKALRGGDWYPRWAPDLNNGYGVPLFNYVYPLPNYVASFLHFFGISFIDAFKLNMFIASVAGAIFFFLWARLFWGNLGGVVSSVFYTFSPYHFVDIYIRGSVGEVWTLAFFPAFLWSVTKFMRNKQKIFFILSSVFLALIIFSHNILALMFFPFALSYILFLIYHEKNKKYLLLNTCYMLLLGLGLSSIFWLPALAERSFVTGLQIYNVKDNFPQLYQLIFPSWGSGFSASASQNQMSFQIGVANLLAVVITVVALFFRKKHEQQKGILLFFLTAFISVFFLMLKVSLPVWERVPFMDYFQFPWRLLSLEILFASFLAGNIFSLRLNWIKLPIFLFLIFLSFGLGIGYTKPAYYHNRNDNYYIARSNFIDGTNSPGNLFSTVWFNRGLNKQSKKATIINGKIISATVQPTMYTLTLSQESESSLTINVAYFPGWKAFVDKKEVKIVPDRNGLISLRVPAGTHVVKIQFENTPIRSFGVILLMVSFLSIFFYPAFRYRGIIPLA